ncbi:MAG: septum formation inhibitor Maf [Parasporobacterium sp.]|nr:septum formation inhibitor Maf [Parasporobacterium sp.]
MKKIILASSSPRRRDLLTQAGLTFDIVSPECDENIDSTEPSEYVEELSRRKCMAAAVLSDKDTDYIIIGADTVVVHDGKILGKPADKNEAYNMLSGLSGRTHAVYTGVTVFDTKYDKILSFCEKTEVKFYDISKNEIISYIETGEPMDKAGAYGIQGLGVFLVERINGDYNNVVGLPVSRLLRVIAEL